MIEVVITWQCLCVKKISIRVLHQQPITEPYMQVHVKKIFPLVFYQFEENQFKIGDV